MQEEIAEQCAENSFPLRRRFSFRYDAVVYLFFFTIAVRRFTV